MLVLYLGSKGIIIKIARRAKVSGTLKEVEVSTMGWLFYSPFFMDVPIKPLEPLFPEISQNRQVKLSVVLP